MAIEKKKGMCYLCWNACGIIAEVEDGERILSVEGDPDCPLNMGWMCERGQKACVEVHDHPDRLNYPLKRAGKRGENKWERISWDQAMDEIAGKLAQIRDEYGPEAVLGAGGTSHAAGGDFVRGRFFNTFGTPNWYSQGINCGGALQTVNYAIYGSYNFSACVPGVTKTIVFWGYNPANSMMLLWPSFLEAQRLGAKLIVIDPRLTETASFADEWLRIRPGTDGALAMGIINVLVEEDLYDHDFVRQWTLGFEEVVERVRPYTPERVAEITTIPEEKIVELARLYALNRPVCHWGHLNWLQLGPSSDSALIYTHILPAITGNLENPGGTQLTWPLPMVKWNEVCGTYDLLDHPLRTRDAVGAYNVRKGVMPKGCETIRLFNDVNRAVHPEGMNSPFYLLYGPLRSYWDAILTEEPYPIKAAIFSCTNAFSSLPNSRLVREALLSENLELVVTMDWFHTPTTQLSDYVLPAADYFERPEFNTLWGVCGYYTASQAVVEPKYERRPDCDIWVDLGRRLVGEDKWPETTEEVFSMMIEPWGVDFDTWAESVGACFPPAQSHTQDVNPDTGKVWGFATPSGKIELKSSLLEKLGIDPLPDYVEPLQSPVSTPEMAREFPLILITGSRTHEYQHGEGRHFGQLRRLHPWPLLELHVETARKLDIADGDWVYVETPLGRVRQKARCIEGIAPDVVHAEAYWWYPEREASDPVLYDCFETNVNAIIPDDIDTINLGGDNYMRALLCKVYRAPEEEAFA